MLENVIIIYFSRISVFCQNQNIELCLLGTSMIFFTFSSFYFILISGQSWILKRKEEKRLAGTWQAKEKYDDIC